MCYVYAYNIEMRLKQIWLSGTKMSFKSCDNLFNSCIDYINLM